MGKKNPRERIVIPAPYRALVRQYAISYWFEKKCPSRETFLRNVPAIYELYVEMCSVSNEERDIRLAAQESLEAVALLIARAVDREQSLVDWIESKEKTYPPTTEDWLKICAAAGWEIIQVYIRELRETGGTNDGSL